MARDHKAVYARRRARAIEQGYTAYAEQRKLRKAGKPKPKDTTFAPIEIVTPAGGVRKTGAARLHDFTAGLAAAKRPVTVTVTFDSNKGPITKRLDGVLAKSPYTLSKGNPLGGIQMRPAMGAEPGIPPEEWLALIARMGVVPAMRKVWDEH